MHRSMRCLIALTLGFAALTTAGQPLKTTVLRTKDGRPVNVRDLPPDVRERLEKAGIKVQDVSRRPELLPTVFEQNRGQTNAAARFLVRHPAFAAFFTQRQLILKLAPKRSVLEATERPQPVKGNVVRVTFERSRNVEPRGLAELKGKLNHLIGRDRSRWIRDIPLFGALHYPALYEGVDLYVHGGEGRLHYGFHVAPQGNPRSIRMRVSGGLSTAVDGQGNLVIQTDRGPVLHSKPKIWERTTGGRRMLEGNFVVSGRNLVSFDVRGRTAGSTVIIDPEIVFSTYFGGSGEEVFGVDGGGRQEVSRGFDLAVGADGRVFVAGTTSSADFPSDDETSTAGGQDIFVLGTDTEQQNLQATIIGGSGDDAGRGIAAGPDGAVFICGSTRSTDFPTLLNSPPEPAGFGGGFVLKLDSSGMLDRGRYIGTTPLHDPNAVQFDSGAQGGVFVAGTVQIFELPGDASVGPVFQRHHAGGVFDGFVIRLDPNLETVRYFTFLGGNGFDAILDLDVRNGDAFVTGSTTSIEFQGTDAAAQQRHSRFGDTTNCPQPSASWSKLCFDAFAARISASGDRLRYFTFFGGDREDYARGIAVDSSGLAVFTGGATNVGVQSQIFVARVESLGGAFLFDTRMAAEAGDHGEDVDIDSANRAHVVGTVRRSGLATGVAAQPQIGGGSDMFWSRLNVLGTIEEFTYLGGSGTEEGFAVAAAGDCALVAGSTTSAGLASQGAIQEDLGGGADLLLAVICDGDGPWPPDIELTKRTEPDPSFFSVEVDDTVEFFITLQNNDSFTHRATIRDEVPPELTIVNVFGENCQVDGNVVTCGPIALQTGRVETVHIVTRANRCRPPIEGSIINDVTLFVRGERITSTGSLVRIDCPRCGDGRPDPGEECDGQTGCRADCRRPRCTDGVLDAGETCDDGNEVDSDRCNNRCEPRKIEGDPCHDDPALCADGLICGKFCFIYEECSIADVRVPCFAPFVIEQVEICSDPTCFREGTEGVRRWPDP